MQQNIIYQMERLAVAPFSWIIHLFVMAYDPDNAQTATLPLDCNVGDTLSFDGTNYAVVGFDITQGQNPCLNCMTLFYVSTKEESVDGNVLTLCPETGRSSNHICTPDEIQTILDNDYQYDAIAQAQADIIYSILVQQSTLENTESTPELPDHICESRNLSNYVKQMEPGIKIKL